MHANPEKLHLLMLLFLLMFSPSGSLASAKWNGSKIFKWDMHEKATQSELQCSICERVTYRFEKSYVLTRLDIRAYVLYMLCVCVCDRVYQRNPVDQWTVRSLWKRRKVCTLYPAIPEFGMRVCTRHRERQMCVCVCETWKDQQSREIKVNDMKQETSGRDWESGSIFPRLSSCLSCSPRAPLVCSVCCCHGKGRK